MAGHCATSASKNELETRIGQCLCLDVTYSHDAIIGSRIPLYDWTLLHFICSHTMNCQSNDWRTLLYLISDIMADECLVSLKYKSSRNNNYNIIVRLQTITTLVHCCR